MKEDREIPYWIANFLAGIGMVGCLMLFAASFPGRESQSPTEAVADASPAIKSCVEQVQVMTFSTLEEISVKSRQSGCGTAILEQARFLQVYVEGKLNALPAKARRSVIAHLPSKIMENRFVAVIQELSACTGQAPSPEREPLEAALEVIKRVAARFDGTRPTVAIGSDEAASGSELVLK